jgi:hypothetical protein
MARNEVIKVGSAEFDEKEEAVLAALYEVSDGSYSTYSLATRLNPGAEDEEAEKAFEDVRATTEGLIAKGIIRGERLTGANGVYFERFKLTPKGERKGN